MTCPRCKGRMHTARDEMRKHQGDVVELQASEGIACINCGNRIYPSIKEAVPFDKSMILPKQDMNGATPGRKPTHCDLMKKYCSSIGEMRNGKHPTGWDSIAKLISTAEGVKITGETVKKHYEALTESYVTE